MKEFKTDVPVLLIFFTRPDTFEQVFAAVKEARPSKLFLACDGPRENRPDDIEKIAACKKIAEDIDWECEIHTDYAEKNMGCGMRPQTAITWALSIVDRIVVLEDDCVPEQTFFSYMAELLEKYKDDERVGMVSGLNHFVNWDCSGNSYCFVNNGAIWGWGTWARVWKEYDYTLSSLKNPHVQKLMAGEIVCKRAKNKKVQHFMKTVHRLDNSENISYWDSQFGYLRIYKRYLSIVPHTNLIHNIGFGVGSTHANGRINGTEWKKGMLHYMPTAPVELPLKHPDFMMCDNAYDVKTDETWGYPNPVVRHFKRGIRLIKRIFHI